MDSTHSKFCEFNTYISDVKNLQGRFSMRIEEFSTYMNRIEDVPSKEEFDKFKIYMQHMSVYASDIHKGISEISRFVDVDYQRSLPLKKRKLKN